MNAPVGFSMIGHRSLAYVNIQDQKASSTAGGTATSGSWQTRTLNTITSDVSGLVVLASNQITMQPGTYTCLIRCPAISVAWHQARLQNISLGTTLVLGGSSYCNSGASYAQTDSWVIGQFTLVSLAVLEVQHQVNTTRATDGWGVPTAWGTEVYTVAQFWKIA
jgi:hypothetical protein